MEVIRIRTRNRNGLLNIIGARTRFARGEKKWSANDLATQLQLLGVDLASPGIYHIEKGKRSVSDFELLAIAQALEKDVHWLLGLEETS